MVKILFFSSLIFIFHFSQANTVDPKALAKEISTLNDQYKYDEVLRRLEEIIAHPKSEPYDLYHAYLLKAYTYKRVYNYPEVMHFLDRALASAEASKDPKERLEAKVRVHVEKMLVLFDTQKFDEVDRYLLQLSTMDQTMLDIETRAFLANVRANRKMNTGQYAEAEKILDEAIVLLQHESPKHLPAIYVKKIDLAENMKDRERAEDAYKQGIFYAQKYKMDIYEKLLHYTMSYFCAQNQDYKAAYEYQLKGVELTRRYDANTYNGKMTMLDKELLDQRKTKEIEYERRLKFFFILLSVITLALIVVVLKLYQSNRQKNKLVQRENNRMRKELENLTTELDEKGKENIETENANLTPRQIEIIRLVKEGKTNKEIGENLFISENTVKYHLKGIYTALGIATRWDL